jgi:hypothetical protein
MIDVIFSALCFGALMAWIIYVIFFECPDCPPNDWTKGQGRP